MGLNRRSGLRCLFRLRVRHNPDRPARFCVYLPLRLRRGERLTLARIGASQTKIQGVMATEIVVVIAMSVLLSALLTLLTHQFGLALMQQLLLS